MTTDAPGSAPGACPRRILMFRISELARQFGLSRSTLLYYHRIGLLTPSGRSGSGYRLYSSSDRERLEAICSFRQAGLGIEDIRSILSAVGDDTTAIMQQRLRSVGKEIRSLQASQRLLAGMLRLQGQGGPESAVDKEMFVGLLRTAGMDDEAMRRLHAEFEQRAPEAHHNFLLMLGIPEIEINLIRRLSAEAGEGSYVEVSMPEAASSGMETLGRIVRADVTDAAAILELQRLAYQSEALLYDDRSIPPLTQTLDEIKNEFDHTTFLKTSTNGSLIGSVRASLHDGTCTIGRLIVHPEFQRKGIGSRLLSAIETEFPSAKRFELFTGSRSEGTIRLYERLGYRIFRTERLSPRVELVFLEKPRQ